MAGTCYSLGHLGDDCTHNAQCLGYPATGCVPMNPGGTMGTCQQLPEPPSSPCVATTDDNANHPGSNNRWLTGCDYTAGYCDGDPNHPVCMPYPTMVDAACDVTWPPPDAGYFEPCGLQDAQPSLPDAPPSLSFQSPLVCSAGKCVQVQSQPMTQGSLCSGQ